MNLVLVVVAALPSAAAAVLVTRSLLTAHSHTTPEAIAAMLAAPHRLEPAPRAEDLERSLTRDLLAGNLSARKYRREVAGLAALEPQPRSLQELLG